jgi:hypothetical protein
MKAILLPTVIATFNRAYQFVKLAGSQLDRRTDRPTRVRRGGGATACTTVQMLLNIWIAEAA